MAEVGDEEVIGRHRRKQPRIVDDVEDVPDEVKLMAENVDTVEVKVAVAKNINMQIQYIIVYIVNGKYNLPLDIV